MRDSDPDVIIGKILHPIGIALTSSVLLTLLILSLIDFKLVNRLTIRLISTLALSDLCIHLSEILSLGSDRIIGTPYCEFLAAYRYFGRLFYFFTNIAISYHLYRSIILLKNSSIKFEVVLWFSIIFIISVIMIIFGFLGTYSGTISKIECRPGSDNKLFFRIEESLIGILACITLIICVSIFFISRKRFDKIITSYANSHLVNESDRAEFKQKRKRMATRSFLYPLATIITLPAPIILSVMDLIEVHYYWIYLMLALTQGLSGILTSLAFSLDPAVWDSLKAAKGKVKKFTQGRKNFKILTRETKDGVPSSTDIQL